MSLKTLFMKCVAALERIEVYEAYIKKDESNTRYYGLQEPGKIWINPITPTVESLLHELIHEVKPEWSEATVTGMTTRMILSLSDDEIQEFYARFQANKTPRKAMKAD